MKEIVDNLRKIRNKSRSRSKERKYSPYRNFKNKEVNKEEGTTCYKCWAKGHIATNCPKKN